MEGPAKTRKRDLVGRSRAGDTIPVQKLANHADPDRELVLRSQEGDTRAFDELVDRHSRRLYGLVYNMTGNHEDSNDILQEVFAKAFRSIRRFRGKSTFGTWIYSIALNMSRNFLRKRSRRREFQFDPLSPGIYQDDEFEPLVAKGSPDNQVNLNELQVRLNEALMQLSEDHRAVVIMFDIQGMPHAKISDVLGVSAGTVRSRLFYAHQQLQNYLEEFRR
ncbi:MAG: sigma-70 family RNA polymerase sigma factor [Verrucomicrobiota bacterium]